MQDLELVKCILGENTTIFLQCLAAGTNRGIILYFLHSVFRVLPPRLWQVLHGEMDSPACLIRWALARLSSLFQESCVNGATVWVASFIIWCVLWSHFFQGVRLYSSTCHPNIGIDSIVVSLAQMRCPKVWNLSGLKNQFKVRCTIYDICWLDKPRPL